jgi:hypothetical protein
MNCKKCNVQMIAGKALSNDAPRLVGWRFGIAAVFGYNSNAKLVDVFKCPQCGYSHN